MVRSLGQKSIFLILVIAAVALIFSFLVLSWFANKTTNETYMHTKENLILHANNAIESKLNVGITNAVALSSNADLRIALEEKDKDLAFEIFSTISDNYKNNTRYKNVKIHLHTPDIKSFLRVWEPNTNDDDLSSFRPSIVEVYKTRNSINSFEVDRTGMNIHSIVPVIENGYYLGSLEFIQGVNSIARLFDKSNDAFLLLMNESVYIKNTAKIIYRIIRQRS